ncbi:MAG: hypothetical protein HY938_01985 [Nitrosomonadales bacterium]|nr:hypothetical protein [Nitrosomonadales bacterium]
MFRLLLAMLLVSPAWPAYAGVSGGMFGEGRSQFTLVAGNAYAFEKSYFVIGGSASYYLVDGLGVGVSLENWSGGGPGIRKYAPFVQYVFYQVPRVQPYVGAFYRHTSISGLPGIKSTGARAGLLLASGANAYVSIGVVHEAYLDCQVSIYRVCRETYPDITVAFGF